MNLVRQVTLSSVNRAPQGIATCARSSGVECFIDIEEVPGSNPGARTIGRLANANLAPIKNIGVEVRGSTPLSPTTSFV